MFDTDTGGGVRMEAGAQRIDELETRVWNETSFVSEQERCDTVQQLFKQFAGATGARCPATH